MKKTSLKKVVLAILLLLLLMAGGLLLVWQKQARLASAPAQTARPTVVQTTLSKTGNLTASRTYLGVVEAWQTANLASRITSPVLAVKFREGEWVRAGEVLILLDDTELRSAAAGAGAQMRASRQQTEALAAQVTTLEESVRYWQQEQERDLLLVREGAMARTQAEASGDRLNQMVGELNAARKSLEAAHSQLQAQREKLAEAETRATYSLIRSPFAGVVLNRRAEPGDLAVPGQPLLEVADYSRNKVRFEIPQQDLKFLAKGAPVRIDAGEAQLTAAISRLHPSFNPNRTLTAEAELPPEARFRAGEYHRLEVDLQRFTEVVLVPEESLLPAPDGQMTVFTVIQGKTRSRPVKLLAVAGGLAAVEGLEAGVPVIRSTYLGWNRLAAGEPVEVAP